MKIIYILEYNINIIEKEDSSFERFFSIVIYTYIFFYIIYRRTTIILVLLFIYPIPLNKCKYDFKI